MSGLVDQILLFMNYSGILIGKSLFRSELFEIWSFSKRDEKPHPLLVIAVYIFIRKIYSNRESFGWFLGAGYGRHCTLESHLLLVNFILFQPNFRIIELVFPWYLLHTFNLYIHYIPLFFRAYSTAFVLIFPQKVCPHDHNQPNRQYPSHQK